MGLRDASASENFELDLGLTVLANNLGKKRQTNKIHRRFTGMPYIPETTLQEWENLPI